MCCPPYPLLSPIRFIIKVKRKEDRGLLFGVCVHGGFLEMLRGTTGTDSDALRLCSDLHTPSLPVLLLTISHEPGSTDLLKDCR